MSFDLLEDTWIVPCMLPLDKPDNLDMQHNADTITRWVKFNKFPKVR